MLEFGTLFNLTIAIISPFCNMISSDHNKINVCTIPFKQELMDFHENITKHESFVIVFWILIILLLIDLFKTCKGFIEWHHYCEHYIMYGSHVVLCIILAYGVLMENPMCINVWMFVFRFIILVKVSLKIFCRIVSNNEFGFTRFRLIFDHVIRYVLSFYILKSFGE